MICILSYRTYYREGVFKTTATKHLCHLIHYNQKSKNKISNERTKQNTKIILIADERNLVCYFYVQKQKMVQIVWRINKYQKKTQIQRRYLL